MKAVVYLDFARRLTLESASRELGVDVDCFSPNLELIKVLNFDHLCLIKKTVNFNI